MGAKDAAIVEGMFLIKKRDLKLPQRDNKMLLVRIYKYVFMQILHLHFAVHSETATPFEVRCRP